MSDNVAVLHTSDGTASIVFDNLSALVETVAEFIDRQNGWDKRCLVTVVHRNGQTIQWLFKSVRELEVLAEGIQLAGWLFTNEGGTPSQCYMSWLDKGNIETVFEGLGDPTSAIFDKPE